MKQLTSILSALLLLSVACSLTRGVTAIAPTETSTAPPSPADRPGGWYVSPQGDDGDDGRSPATAFRTLQRALEVVQPGQTILILPGTYHEAIEVYNLGAAEAPIVIRGDPDGAVIFDGQRNACDPEAEDQVCAAFHCWWCENITVENLTIRNYAWSGVGIFLSRGVTLRNLHIQDTGFEIHPDLEDGGTGITVLESEDVTLENNIVEHTGMKLIHQEISGYGIDLWRCQNCTVRGNTVRSVTGTGILVEESCNVIVESNTIEDGEMEMLDWWDGGIWLDGGHDVVVRNNTFRDNHGPGIQVSDTEAVYPEGSYGFVLEGNISQNNEFGMYLWNFGLCPPPEEAVRLSGNLVNGNRQRDLWCVEWQCGEGPLKPYGCNNLPFVA